MAKISARGAHKVGEVRCRRSDSENDATFVFVLCSDGRVLVRFIRPSGYTAPGMPPTINSGYSVHHKRRLPLHLDEIGILEADLERKGWVIER